MTIRRSNSNTISIENSQDKSNLTIKSLDGQLLVKASNGSDEIEISKPGDYEYFGLGITGFEVTAEKYTGVINLLKVNVEGVRIVFMSRFNEIQKDIVTNLANIDIMLIPLMNSNNVKTVVSTVEPKKLVIIKSFDGGEEVELDSVQKSVGIVTIEEVNSVKHKSADFATTTEDIILLGEVLA